MIYASNISVGIDVEEIARFKNKNLVNDAKFFELIYTPKELEYCFAKAYPAKHLAVRYCAKEAVVKALSFYNIKDVLYNEIEVCKKTAGMPFIKLFKYPTLTIKVSLSHSRKTACASVLIIKA